MSITLTIPRDIEQQLEQQWGELPRRALESLALEAYREGHLSAGQVAELLGLDFWRTEAFLKKHAASLDYSGADLERDEAALEGMLAS